MLKVLISIVKLNALQNTPLFVIFERFVLGVTQKADGHFTDFLTEKEES